MNTRYHPMMREVARQNLMGEGPVRRGVESSSERVNRLVHPAARKAPRDEPAETPEYQRDGRAYLGGYFSNPFEEEGRANIGTQLWEAPAGGWIRRGLEGQEVFGHTITGGQARVAEQAMAGLTATGIGVPTFMAALNSLTTPQSQDTIPM